MKLKITFSFFLFCSALMAQYTDISSGKIGIVYYVRAITADTIVATGNNGLIYFSHDGGQTFDSTATIFNFGEWFNDLEFTASGKIYVCGGTAFGNHLNFLASSDDYGLSWDSLTSNQFAGYNFLQMDFVSDQIGFIRGENDLLLKTLDGGQSFSQIAIPPNTKLNGVVLVDNQIGFISTIEYDLTGSSIFKIFKTIDQGLNWKEVYINSITGNHFSAVKNINSFSFTDPMTGHAVGNNGIVLKTIDGGENWSSQTLVNDSTFFMDVYFINDDLGYALGIYAFAGNSRSSWTTNDGGINWSKDPYSFTSISFANDSLGYAVQNGVIYKTSQAGNIGINENAASTLNLFPNPISSGEFLHLENLKESETIEIYDASGRLVIKRQYEGPFQLAKFKAGIYFLKVDGTLTKTASFLVVE